jgi:DNA-binding NarL/FixJ family response regulator
MTVAHPRVARLSSAPAEVSVPRRVSTMMAVAVVGPDARMVARVRSALHREGLAASVDDGGRAQLALDGLQRRPEVVVLAGLNGDAASVAHAIRRRLRDVHVVLVLPADSEQRARHVLDAGVDGVVLEEELEVTLGVAVRAACSGQLCVPRSLRHEVELPAFSHRERQILRLVVAGHTNAEIARRIYLSRSTVAGHLTAIFRRLGVRSRSEIVALILAADESVRRNVLGVEEVRQDGLPGARL